MVPLEPSAPVEDPRWLEEWKPYQDTQLFFTTYAAFMRNPKRFAADFVAGTRRVLDLFGYDLAANAALATLITLWPTIDRSKVTTWVEQMLILSAGLLPSLLIHGFFKWSGSTRQLRSTVAAICFGRGSLAVCMSAVTAPVVLLKARFGFDVIPSSSFSFAMVSFGVIVFLAVTLVGLALAGTHRVRAVYGLFGALAFWAMSVVTFNLATRFVVGDRAARAPTAGSVE